MKKDRDFSRSFQLYRPIAANQHKA